MEIGTLQGLYTNPGQHLILWGNLKVGYRHMNDMYIGLVCNVEYAYVRHASK